MSASTVSDEKAPGHAVKPGDVLTIALDNSVRILKVVALCRTQGRRARRPRALRRFAGPPGMTI